MQAATPEADAKSPLWLSPKPAQPQQKAADFGPATPPRARRPQCDVPADDGAEHQHYRVFPEGSALREAYALARRGLIELARRPPRCASQPTPSPR